MHGCHQLWGNIYSPNVDKYCNCCKSWVVETQTERRNGTMVQLEEGKVGRELGKAVPAEQSGTSVEHLSCVRVRPPEKDHWVQPIMLRKKKMSCRIPPTEEMCTKSCKEPYLVMYIVHLPHLHSQCLWGRPHLSMAYRLLWEGRGADCATQ